MSTEPVIPRPAQEGHEPNTKKKLVHNGNAIEFAKDRKSQGLAGLIMWLPGDAKGVPRDYVSLKHPVVILSPAISATNRVEIVGVGSSPIISEDLPLVCSSRQYLVAWY